ncbi:hypothetical protein ACFLRI_01535 [Bacteroidota bacterium]
MHELKHYLAQVCLRQAGDASMDNYLSLDASFRQHHKLFSPEY